jgi:hypothetical protein
VIASDTTAVGLGGPRGRYPGRVDGVRRTGQGPGLDQAAGLLAAARRIVVFSGAGISTDSRIIL